MRKWLVLAFGIVCISLSAIFVRRAAVDGLAQALYRIAFAFFAVAPARFLRKGKSYPLANRLLCVVGGFFFGLELAFWNVSVMISDATTPTLLVNLSAVWVALGASFLLGERTSPFHWIGTAVSLSGVAVIVGLSRIVALDLGTGVTFALAASAFLAAYTLVIRKARAGMDTISVLYYALLGSFIPLFAACLAGNVPLWGYSPQSWVYLAALGVVTQVGGYFAINYALGHISSVKVSLSILAQPVLTAVFASLLIQEVIPERTMMGGGIVLVGIGVSFLGTKKRQLLE